MKLKEIISNIILDVVNFRRTEALADTLYNEIEFDERAVSLLLYQKIVKLNDRDTVKIAELLQNSKDLIFKRR